MEQKILDVTFHKKNPAATVLLIIGLILAAGGLILAFSLTYNMYWEDGFGYYSYILGRYYYTYYYEFYDTFFDFLINTGFWSANFLVGFFIALAGLVMIIIQACLRGGKSKQCALTITNMRIVGKASNGQPVDLPLAYIYSAMLGSGDSLIVTSTNGQSLMFKNVMNKDYVCQLLNSQLAALRNAAMQQNAPMQQNAYPGYPPMYR